MRRIESVTPFSAARSTHYSVVIVGVGGNARSLFALDELVPEAPVKIGLDCSPDKTTAGMRENLDRLEDQGFVIHRFEDESQYSGIESIINSALESRLPTTVSKILIDISSINGRVLGELWASLCSNSLRSRIQCDFVYSPAQFYQPDTTHSSLLGLDAIHPWFQGWTITPDIAVSLIIGIGFEPEIAAGIHQMYEPNGVWVFMADSPDQRYRKSLEAANQLLITELPDPDRWLEYPINSPVDLIVGLDSLVGQLVRVQRPVIVAGGPKVFALASLIVASLYYPTVSVIRPMRGHLVEKESLKPTGEICGVSVGFDIQVS